MQGYDRRNDRHALPQQQSGMRAYPNVSAAAGQGASRHAPGQASAQQSIAAGLPVLSDSSEDEDDLPLPGSTSMRAMSVLQKYLSGTPTDTPTAAAEAAAPQAAATAAVPRPHAMTATASHMQHNSTQAATLADPRAGGQGRALLNRGGPARPLAAGPSGYSSDSDHSQMNGAARDALRTKSAAAASAAAAAGDGASDDMDMSPIVEHEKGDSLDSKALAKLPAQVLHPCSPLFAAAHYVPATDMQGSMQASLLSCSSQTCWKPSDKVVLDSMLHTAVNLAVATAPVCHIWYCTLATSGAYLGVNPRL